MITSCNCTCGSFVKILDSFRWFEFDDSKGTDDDILLMPTIGEKKYRVNHCPVCGGDVRNMVISETELKESENFLKN